MSQEHLPPVPAVHCVDVDNHGAESTPDLGPWRIQELEDTTTDILGAFQRPADIGLFKGRSIANDAERQLFKDFARFAMRFNRQFESIPDLGTVAHSRVRRHHNRHSRRIRLSLRCVPRPNEGRQSRNLSRHNTRLHNSQPYGMRRRDDRARAGAPIRAHLGVARTFVDIPYRR
jgi:hypothetical protein